MNVKYVTAITAAVSLAAGSLAGYFFAKRQLKAQYQEDLEREIEEAKKYYKTLYKREEFSTPEKAAASLQRRTPAKPAGFENETPEEIENNANFGAQKFVDTLHENRYGTPTEEVDVRSEKVPYVIGISEYMAGEKGHSQVILVYYAGDDILADEDDQPLDDVESSVGEANLQKFGLMSEDENVVYVRNDRLQIDYEICKTEERYGAVVAGFEQVEDLKPELITRRNRRG